MSARRVTIYKTNGRFYYRVQAGNWKCIDDSEQGFRQKKSVLKRIEKLYPGIEVADKT